MSSDRSDTDREAKPSSTGLAAGVTLIRDVRVFDGARVCDADAVIVRDGLIAEIGRGLAMPEGAEIVEGGGGMLLPGLIDAHTHTLEVTDLQQALVFGVTTELDMFCTPERLAPLRDAAASRSDVADIRSAGIGATAPRGHVTQLVEMGIYPPFPTISEPGAASDFVAARVGEGSDYFKIMLEHGTPLGWKQLPVLDRETIAALVEAAHAQGLRTVAHISTQAEAQLCVAAGIDGLAHLFVDGPPDPDFVNQAVAAGIFATPTIVIYEWLYGPRRRHIDYVDHPRLWPYLHPMLRAVVQADSREGLPTDIPDWASAEHTQEATLVLHQAGVPVLAGTDSLAPGSPHGLSLHSELAALVDAGLTPTEALTAATRAPARAFGLADRGRIEAGLRADLLLVDGDPTSDIAATAEIIGVWRGGHRFDREAYRATLGD